MVNDSELEVAVFNKYSRNNKIGKEDFIKMMREARNQGDKFDVEAAENNYDELTLGANKSGIDKESFTILWGDEEEMKQEWKDRLEGWLVADLENEGQEEEVARSMVPSKSNKPKSKKKRYGLFGGGKRKTKRSKRKGSKRKRSKRKYSKRRKSRRIKKKY